VGVNVPRDVVFGQYYPKKSFIHNLDPRVKILIMVAYMTGVFLSQSFYAYIPAAAFFVLAVTSSRVPPLKVLKSVRPVLILVIFTSMLNVFFNREGEVLASWWVFTITDAGLRVAGMLALRLCLLVAGTSLITFTTTPVRMTDGIESLLKPLKIVKFPVQDVAMIMSIALRFIPILSEEVEKIMLAQKARGASFDRGGLVKRAKALLPIIIPLLVSAFRRAEELALAMDARCYNATPKRTKLKELKLTWRDPVAVLLTAIFVTAVVAINSAFWGLF
jgi:energy-coupling factor transport system permease protein